MTGEVLGFWLLAFLLVFSSLSVVLFKNLFHSALALAMSLATTALLFLSLHAELLAAVQILLYTGGVVTLVLFAIMLTERITGVPIQQTNRGVWIGALLASGLFLFLAVSLLRSPSAFYASLFPEDLNMTLARGIFNEFALAFEVLSLLLLAAVLGAILLARKD